MEARVTLTEWIALGAFLSGIVGALILHARKDGRTEQKVAEHARRLAKLDGIKNGD
jgi:hypothetical protein